MTLVGWAIAVARPFWRPRTAGIMLLLAAAAMVLVSLVELVPAAVSAGLPASAILLWAVIGVSLVLLLRRASGLLLPSATTLERSALVIAVALAVHNVPEGAAPYAAALISLQGGIVTALALGLHNIAEGLAIATPVVAGGGTRRRAFWLTAMATVGEAGGALLAYTFTAGIDEAVAGAVVALVAGVMIAVSVLELLPAGLQLVRTVGRVGAGSAVHSVPSSR